MSQIYQTFVVKIVFCFLHQIFILLNNLSRVPETIELKSLHPELLVVNKRNEINIFNTKLFLWA